MCKWCDELNEEAEKIVTDTIKLSDSGYYRYHVPIYHCPACGTRLKKYSQYTLEQLLNGLVQY